MILDIRTGQNVLTKTFNIRLIKIRIIERIPYFLRIILTSVNHWTLF